jgi:gluconokinase
LRAGDVNDLLGPWQILIQRLFQGCAVRPSRSAASFISAACWTKIRLHARSELPSDYHENLGKGFDEKCVTFLQIDYDQLARRVNEGGRDEEILQWCFDNGRRPSEDDIYIWNEFMRKRGWNDEVSETLKRRKQEAGMSDRSDIETAFQFIDADEGRLPRPGPADKTPSDHRQPITDHC